MSAERWRIKNDHLRPHRKSLRCGPMSSCWWCHVDDPGLLAALNVAGDKAGRRACSALTRAGVRTLARLYEVAPLRISHGLVIDELADVDNLGPVGIAYIRERLGLPGELRPPGARLT